MWPRLCLIVVAETVVRDSVLAPGDSRAGWETEWRLEGGSPIIPAISHSHAGRADAPPPDPPPAPKRGGVFWGWWIVIGAVVAQFAGMGAGGGIAGVFLRPMTEDLGWTSAEYTRRRTQRTRRGGLAGFVVGPADADWRLRLRRLVLRHVERRGAVAVRRALDDRRRRGLLDDRVPG